LTSWPIQIRRQLSYLLELFVKLSETVRIASGDLYRFVLFLMGCRVDIPSARLNIPGGIAKVDFFLDSFGQDVIVCRGESAT